MNPYHEIRDKQPEYDEAFFSFSTEQFNDGLKKFNLSADDVKFCGAGLYATDKGFTKIDEFYKEQRKEIGEKCDPQKVYDYEYDNHECSYTNDDTAPLELIEYYFGKEGLSKIKRHRYNS